MATLRSYTRSLNILRKALDAQDDDLTFLKDYEMVINWIEGSKYALNSKKTIYIAVVASIKSIDEYAEACLKYREKMDSLNKAVQTGYEAQTLSVSETAKWLPWSEILKVVETARLAIEDCWSLQEYLILALYTMIPPVRLDYGSMMIVPVEPAKPVGNYLVLDSHPYFLFADYKTFSTYGILRNPIPPALLKVIKEWIEFSDEYLLISKTEGGPLGDVALGQLIISIFQKHCKKNIGVSILRHSYISYLRAKEMPVRQSDKLAKQMMHSPKMSMIYRKI
tara:strand:+ start:737 stop:1576 length:840 start_codon:yes stop_codon:yes gene_type:complete